MEDTDRGQCKEQRWGQRGDGEGKKTRDEIEEGIDRKGEKRDVGEREER